MWLHMSADEKFRNNFELSGDSVGALVPAGVVIQAFIVTI